jgi:hypothetical protein
MQLTQCTDFEAPKPKYLESHVMTTRADFTVESCLFFAACVENSPQALLSLSMVRKSPFKIAAQGRLKRL